MNNDMDFNEDGIFNKDFTNGNYGLPNNSNNNTTDLAQSDLPPELGEIKNLSDASISQAPTMDALSPANFTTEDQKLVSDPLDLYENKGFISNNNQIDNLVSNQESINNIGSLYNNDLPDDIEGKIENNYALKSELNIDSPINLSEFNFSNKTTEESKAPKTEPNYNSTSSDFLINKQNYDSNEFEIINKSLSDVSEEENSNFESTKETPKEAIDALENDFSSEESIQGNSVEVNNKSLDDIEIKDDLSLSNLPEKEIDTHQGITDINDLGIDDAYTEPDSLEIMDNDLIDEINEDPVKESEKLKERKEEINCIDEIKGLVEKLQSKGQKIRLEEFDFEMMHQLIIIVEK